MEIRELERIKKIISTAENKAAKAEGVIEKIKQGWKADFGSDTIEGAKTELEKISEQIKTQTLRQKELLKELEELTDWDELEAGLK